MLGCKRHAIQRIGGRDMVTKLHQPDLIDPVYMDLIITPVASFYELKRMRKEHDILHSRSPGFVKHFGGFSRTTPCDCQILGTSKPADTELPIGQDWYFQNFTYLVNA